MYRLFAWIKDRAKLLKSEGYALYIATKDPRTPWFAKLVAVVVVAYLFSPIDLIPDFIPVLGYLDDLILVPLGMAIAIKMIPANVLTDSRKKAQELIDDGNPVNHRAAAVIVFLWLAVIAGGTFWAYGKLFGDRN